MGEHKEVRYERLYVKVPGSDSLRKTAAGRLRYLAASGWREIERQQKPDYLQVRLERTGHAPVVTRIHIPKSEQQRTGRGSRPGFGGGRQGGPGGRQGGPGGRQGGPGARQSGPAGPRQGGPGGPSGGSAGGSASGR